MKIFKRDKQTNKIGMKKINKLYYKGFSDEEVGEILKSAYSCFRVYRILDKIEFSPEDFEEDIKIK
ncbi:MAG: hypothetical protein IKL74_04425 [Clostridia bacterium]|nr:hypothetical protein [Clostridia bacterium]MBR6720134.1 hypothetical protein [Clostridia bacterium]